MARFCILVLLASYVPTLVGAQNYKDLENLGVNFAIPADGDPAEMARRAAELGVVRIKLFDYSNNSIYQLRKYYAFANRKLEIMVAIPQWLTNPPDGHGKRDWKAIQEALATIRKNSDIVKGIFVYNEPCIHGFCDGQAGEDYLALLDWFSDRLKDNGMTVSTPFSSPCMMPMQGQKIPFFQRVVKILQKTGSPITVNLYPYLDYCFKPWNIDLNVALGSAGPDGPPLKYSQIDADITRAHGDMARIGFPNQAIQIGESGWAHYYDGPPVGDDAARKALVKKVSNFAYSNKFYLNLVGRLGALGLKGIYIFGLWDENYKPAIFPAFEGEKYFGISGLYADASKAPWHIDDPSAHGSTGFATMRKSDWKQFQTEQANLKWVSENQPKYAAKAKKQLAYETKASAKYRAGPKHMQVKSTWAEDELKSKHESEAEQTCTLMGHDVFDNNAGTALPCCENLVKVLKTCRETDKCEFCLKPEEKWELGSLRVITGKLLHADYVAGFLAAAVCTAAAALFWKRGRSASSRVPLVLSEGGELETGIGEE